MEMFAANEQIVVQRVRQYLTDLRRRLPTTVGFSNPTDLYSIKTEYRIQIGSSKCRADVVLVKEDLPLIWGFQENPLIVIVECKAVGREGDGVEQLKSYLAAADTRFGIFAASLQADDWQYYENHGRNKFVSISPQDFEAQVRDEEDLAIRKQVEAEKRISQGIERRSDRTEQKLELEYKRKEENLQSGLQRRLKEERSEGFKNGFWAGVISVIALVIVIAIIASGG